MSRLPSTPRSPCPILALCAAFIVSAGGAFAPDAWAQPNRKAVKRENKHALMTVKAKQMTGRPEREVKLEGEAEIVRDATRIESDTACFRQVEGEVEANGNVRLWRFGDRYKGDQLKLNLDSSIGSVLHPEYKIELNNAQGRAARLDFLGPDEVRFTNGTYSTCEGPNPDWYLKASTLLLDSGRDVGVASSTNVYFQGVPIIWTPVLSFSLSGARRSGWLSPIVGISSKGGAEFGVPYYVNIAPNRDLTLTPKVILTRGLQLGASGRYLGTTDAGLYSGETSTELLAHDRQRGTNRWSFTSRHTQALATDLSFGWNVRAASDDDYLSDFSKSVSTSAERQLLRELRTDYQSRYWSMSARAQSYQVLQDPAAADNPALTVARPYERLPQINFRAGRFDVGGFDWTVDAELTRFWHPDLVRGTRAVLTPQLSYPWVRPGYFITPRLIGNASVYSLDGNVAGERTLTRVLPTASLDAGMVFERDAKLAGKAVTQTLEPRLFYVYTPYRDQSAFPNFDSAEAGFSFAQIFNENRFIGSDRVADANQVTAAVVSRFIESDGAERLRLALGQRFYFREQRVLLGGGAPSGGRSDVLAAAAGRISSEWGFDSAVQYNAAAHQVVSTTLGAQWQPAPKRVINAEYRYLRDSFQNVDISSQWPLGSRWYGLGRVSFSLRDRKLLDGLVGLEYNADCWAFRMGGQRFVTTAQNVSTRFSFQLELSGLVTIPLGSSIDALYKSIPGYTQKIPAPVR